MSQSQMDYGPDNPADLDDVMDNATPIERGKPEPVEGEVVDARPGDDAAEPKEGGLAKQNGEQGGRQKWPIALFDEHKQTIAEACVGVTPKKLRATLGFALMRNPDILKCKPASVLTAIIQAAKLGVDPTGSRNSAHFIPRKGELVLQLGYGAVIDLMCRTAGVRSIDARVVYEGDTFSVGAGTNPSITHKPHLDHEKRGEATHYYAVAFFETGGFKFEVMTKAEIERIKNRYVQFQNGPWKSEYDEMAKKTVIHRLAKTMPLSPEASEAIQHVESSEFEMPSVRDAGHTRPKLSDLAGEEGDA